MLRGLQMMRAGRSKSKAGLRPRSTCPKHSRHGFPMRLLAREAQFSCMEDPLGAPQAQREAKAAQQQGRQRGAVELQLQLRGPETSQGQPQGPSRHTFGAALRQAAKDMTSRPRGH